MLVSYIYIHHIFIYFIIIHLYILTSFLRQNDVAKSFWRLMSFNSMRKMNIFLEVTKIPSILEIFIPIYSWGKTLLIGKLCALVLDTCNGNTSLSRSSVYSAIVLTSKIDDFFSCKDYKARKYESSSTRNQWVSNLNTLELLPRLKYRVTYYLSSYNCHNCFLTNAWISK